MFAMHKELLISLSDLEAVSIECSSCHSEVRIRMDAEFKPAQVKAAIPLESCPVCTARFDSTLRPSIENFREAIGILREHSKVTLQVSADG